MIIGLLSGIDAQVRKGGSPMVVREGKRVLIEGAREAFYSHFEDVEQEKTTPWAERSDVYMYLAQMRIAGWEISYADLITIAGYGPSFAYAPGPKDKWMAHYFPVAGRDARIAHATGYMNRWHQYKNVEEYWQALKRAIDSGKAVHGPNEEDILFIGYEEADRPEDRKVMPVAIVFVEDKEWTWEQFQAWHSRQMVNGWFGYQEARVIPWPPRASAIEVMELMVRIAMGDDPRHKLDDGVIWGVDGIEAYAHDLENLSNSGAREEQGGFFQGGWRGCHNVYPQMSGRPAAAVYLRKVAPLFDSSIREHIEVAANAYDNAKVAWTDFDHQLGRAQKDLPHDQAWDNPEHRKAGAVAVYQAAKYERVALSSLQQALTMLSAKDVFPESASLSFKIEVDDETETGNSFGRGLATLFRNAGVDTDYLTVMGDLGQAFSIQGVNYSPDLTGGYADVGWWPLDLFQMESRLPFLTDVVGCDITCKWADFSDIVNDPKGYYREHFEKTVQAEIVRGRPVLSVGHGAFVVTGYNTEDPLLLGWCLRGGVAEKMEVEEYPKAIYTFGAQREPMDRQKADLLALKHAIALGRGKGPTKGEWVTGLNAWKGWEDHLLMRDKDTHHYWHANQRKQTLAWRRCAVDYLEAMITRHNEEVALHLKEAVAAYEQQIECLSGMIITHESIVDPGDGREALSLEIREAARLDMRAVEAIERTVEAMIKQPNLLDLFVDN